MEAGKFTAAILDSLHLLSEVIRDKSGLEGDGVALVGSAFGGASPKLKVNRLQTESEQNIQRGTEALLRGIYQAIRNPRSHGPFVDDASDAYAIIMFVDYLLRLVDRSKSPFSLAGFVDRLSDPDFVPNERYAELLVDEIPEGKRLEVCKEAFSRRAGDAPRMRNFFDRILRTLSVEDRGELVEMLSEELAQTTDEKTVRFVLGAFPPTVWSAIRELPRIRIENKLIQSIKAGKWDAQAGRCTGGVFGTWTTRIVNHITLKDELGRAVVQKLISGDREEQDYAFQYFTAHLTTIFDAPSALLTLCVNNGLKKGDVRFKDLAHAWRLTDELDERSTEDPWRKPFAHLLESFTAAPDDFRASDEDVPF